MAQQLLELQKFILANPSDWKEKLQAKPYCLKIQEDDDLALFKYSQIDSDFSETIYREARGDILERDTWKIVRFAFRKFFNLGEPHADKIDWESATATSKEDGSLISLYYYKGWQIATNGNLYAWNAPLGVAGFQTFEDLAMEALLKYNVDFRSLNKNYTYTFELCSPYNQIVCSYPDIQLFHTVTVDNRTLEEVDVEINPADLRIDTYCASGAGGQYVNRTETAIRITHLPTGIVVQCQDEKSQLKNKEKAMRVLRARVKDLAVREQNAAIAADRKNQVGSGDRSERIRTYNFPQGRVTDHRINLTLYKLDSVLNGDLDELISALITADQSQKLSNE